MKMRAIVVVAMGVLLASCASGLHRPVSEVTARTDAHGVQHVTLHAHTFYFEPNRIVVKANVPVEIVIHNSAFMVPHNFTLAAPAAGIRVERDLSMFHGSGTVRFTPTQPGEYTFFCDKDSHMKRGMTGTLVVRP